MPHRPTNPAQQLQDAFKCPKCRGQKAIVRKVSISTSPLPGIFPIGSGKFYCVTCVLCGYTELYDESAYVKQTEKKRKRLNATQEA